LQKTLSGSGFSNADSATGKQLPGAAPQSLPYLLRDEASSSDRQ
jgi:hypothetical protein